MRLFFATDLHGSLLCFKKFLAAKKFYKADLMILGGDITGKGIVPMVIDKDAATYTLYAKRFVCSGSNEIAHAERIIQSVGFYPLQIKKEDEQTLADSGSLEDKFKECIRNQVETWERLAAERGVQLYLIPGNDDFSFLDVLLKNRTFLLNCDLKAIQLENEWTLIGFGGSNATPWHTYREFEEHEIENTLDTLMQKVPRPERCIWNVHVPPFGSGLDVSEYLDERYRVLPSLGEQEMRPAGSVAVDKMVRKWQPSLALFGHIHESRGWTKIGKTLCVNPGTEYYVGILDGFLAELDASGIKSFQLTRG